MKQKKFRWLVMVLTVAFALSSVTASTSAASLAASTSSGMSEVQPQVATIVKEEEGLRRAYEKHFLLSDGSYEALVYDEPIHKYVDGLWKEIDNTLILRTDARGVAQYSNIDGLMEVSFSQKFGSKLATVRDGEYAISWDIQAALSSTKLTTEEQNFRSVQAQPIPVNMNGISQEEQKKVAVKSTSIIRYNDSIAKDVDVEYTVLPTGVKENIVLNSPQNITAYAINLYVENLRAQLLETGDVEFRNSKDEVVFTMWAPYMYDSASEMSEQITVRMTAKETGHYVVVLTPDAQWLNDPSRVYPVVIDPLIRTSDVKSNIIDNYVLEGNGVQNRNLDRLYFGKRTNGIARTYIKFRQMPYIPSQATIAFASMRLYVTTGTSTHNPINAYRVTGGDWESSTLKWSNQPAATALLTSNLSASSSNSDSKLAYSFSCMSAVQHWYNGSPTGNNQNFGVMIRYANESINDYNAIYSADCTEAVNRPKITITYTMPLNNTTIVWPVASNVPGAYDIRSPWGYRVRNNVGKMHLGIDIGVSYVNVRAVISGTYDYDLNFGTGGIAAFIKQGQNGFRVAYLHMSEVNKIFDRGDYVNAGDVIGKSGNTGDSDGDHLHLRLQYGDDKYQSYNPLEVYHRHDIRSTWDYPNPNPMFLLQSDGSYIPNTRFDFTYYNNDFNNTDATKWAK